MKGIYSLILFCDKTIKVGSLGEVDFSGKYVYIGSAQGPGGVEKRVERHLDLCEGNRDVRHWHIDYVLPESRLLGYCFGSTEKDKECDLAKQIPSSNSIKGFGCSDCSCKSHFLEINGVGEEEIKKAYKNINIIPSCYLG